MGEEFNFNINSDNEDHLWRLNSPNSPNSDAFDPYRFDMHSQSNDPFFDSDLSFDPNSHLNFDQSINQEPTIQQFQDTNQDPFSHIAPNDDQFIESNSFLSQNSVPNHFNQGNFNQMQSITNQQPNQFYDMQLNLGTPSNPNAGFAHSMNQIGSNLNINIGPKGNSSGMLPTTSHRRTPSTPSNIFNFNAFAFQHLQQQAQKQQPQKMAQLTTTQIQQMQQLFGHEITLPQSRNRKMSSQPLPIVPNIATSADEEFNTVCHDPDIKFNPHKLGFIPTKFWPDKDFTFGELVSDFFQRKNNANSRFYHKLYNALKISEDDPFYSEYLGIEWVNDIVLKVDKKKFARLLNIKTIDGSLFHQQGNFPSHGFIELGTSDALNYVTEEDLDKVDYENVRLLVHQNRVFVRGCTEDAIEGCKWVSSRKRH